MRGGRALPFRGGEVLRFRSREWSDLRGIDLVLEGDALLLVLVAQVGTDADDCYDLGFLGLLTGVGLLHVIKI